MARDVDPEDGFPDPRKLLQLSNRQMEQRYAERIAEPLRPEPRSLRETFGGLVIGLAGLVVFIAVVFGLTLMLSGDPERPVSPDDDVTAGIEGAGPVVTVGDDDEEETSEPEERDEPATSNQCRPATSSVREAVLATTQPEFGRDAFELVVQKRVGRLTYVAARLGDGSSSEVIFAFSTDDGPERLVAVTGQR